MGQDHEVTILTRSAPRGQPHTSRVAYVEGDPRQAGKWQESVAEHDGVINLAGASIFCRWTRANKLAIRESRIETTRNLVQGLSGRKGRETVLISASGAGYYGFREEEGLGEDASGGTRFPGGAFTGMGGRGGEGSGAWGPGGPVPPRGGPRQERGRLEEDGPGLSGRARKPPGKREPVVFLDTRERPCRHLPVSSQPEGCLRAGELHRPSSGPKQGIDKGAGAGIAKADLPALDTGPLAQDGVRGVRSGLSGGAMRDPGPAPGPRFRLPIPHPRPGTGRPSLTAQSTSCRSPYP